MIKLLKKHIREFIYNRRSNIDDTIKSNSYLKKNDLTFYIKTFGPKNPNIKFYVIQRAIGGGMFSNLNYVIHHIKIALDLKTDDILELFASIDKKISKHELSAFFRKPDNKSYKYCMDQYLRHFLNALQVKHKK